MWWNKQPKFVPDWTDEPCGIEEWNQNYRTEFVEPGDIVLRRYPDGRLSVKVGSSWYKAEPNGTVHSACYKKWFRTHRLDTEMEK